jgi:DNA-binding XRE family transcriptional regulator
MSAINAESVEAEIARVRKRIAEMEGVEPLRPVNESDWIGRLRSAREGQRLSQATIARRMGTSQSAVSDIEKGNNAPEVLTLAAYAAAIGYRMRLTFEPLDDLTLEGTEA